MKNQKLNDIILVIICMLLSSLVSVAATGNLFDSNEVVYDNTHSEMNSTNVQDAIDELYTKANSDSFWVNKYKTFVAAPQYYAFGTYKGWCSRKDTSCNSYADFPTTSTTPPSGKTVYAAKYTDGQYGVCIKRNGTEHCFRARNYTAELKHVQDVFSDNICDVYPSSVMCSASDFNCALTSDGYVECSDNFGFDFCYVDTNGYVNCP